jgi:hypothetical protein
MTAGCPTGSPERRGTGRHDTAVPTYELVRESDDSEQYAYPRFLE